MFFLKPSPIISADAMNWQHETYKWLIGNFGSMAFSRKLVTPSKPWFPEVAAAPGEMMRLVFAWVKFYAGMTDSPCILESREPQYLPHASNNEDNRVVISINEDLLTDTQALIATLAHDLSRYLVGAAKTPPPGGWDNRELVVDLAAIYLGFGIFLTNTSFRFHQYINNPAQGCSPRGQGYLTENELLHALAIFVLLFGVNQKEPERYLKGTSVARYRKALKYIKSQNILTELQSARKTSSVRQWPANAALTNMAYPVASDTPPNASGIL